ncbi:MAG: hypothetical protein QME41_06260 [Actinomycetota bacterium]|nr:hypothetical protein [Actinomycetota bacterium]
MNASKVLVAVVVIAIVAVTGYGLLNGTVIKKDESNEGMAGASVAGAGQGVSQGGGQGEGSGNGGLGGLKVDTDNLLKLTGKVVSAELDTTNYFKIDSGEKVYDVNVGARWYWEYKGIGLEPGDNVTVTGFDVQGLSAPTLAASTVVNEDTDKTIRVRSDEGAPVWRDETEGECADDGIGGFSEQ